MSAIAVSFVTTSAAATLIPARAQSLASVRTANTQPAAVDAGIAGGKTGTFQNWPCAGCMVFVPHTYDPNLPTALLVALHGDEGVSTVIASVFTPLVNRANVILFAPQCPTDDGCRLSDGSAGYTNSWWGWLQFSKQYDDGWIGRQVRSIAARYNLDRHREYLVGWSGGADYLGWYALRHATQFAAVAFVAGGTPYYSSCPSTKLAAYFLMGSADFRYLSGQPTQVRQVLRRCGNPTKMVVLAGADHQATIANLAGDRGGKILTWLLSHTLTHR